MTKREERRSEIMERHADTTLAVLRGAEAAAEAKKAEAEAAGAAAAEERRLADEATAALQEAQLASRRVRIKRQGRLGSASR